MIDSTNTQLRHVDGSDCGRSTSRQSPLAFFLAFAILVFGSGNAIAQDEIDSSFRDFRSESPSPDQLVQALSSLPGLKVPPTGQQQLQNQILKMMQDMTPEQRKGLMEWGQRFRKESQESGGFSPETRQQLEQMVGPEMRERIQEQIKESDPETLNQMIEQFNRSNSAGGNNRDFQFPSDFPLNRDRRDPSSRENSRPSNSPPFGEGIRDWQNNRSNNSNRPNTDPGSPSNEGVNEMIERARERAQREAQLRQEQGQSSRPGMSVDRNSLEIPEPKQSPGTQFDQMIMKAIQKSQSSGGDGGGGSKFSNGFSSLLEDVVGSVHTRMMKRNWDRQSSQGGGGNGPRFQGGSRSWRMPRIGGSSGVMPDVQQISWFMMACLFVTLLALGSWVAWQVWGPTKVRPNDPGSFRRSFRLSNVKTAADFVEALDGYLLANFGKPSSWWHSRRAEVALNAAHPNRKANIKELVDCYEFARYSEVGDSLPENKIQQCAGILADLAKRQTAAETQSNEANQEEPHSLISVKGA